MGSGVHIFLKTLDYLVSWCNQNISGVWPACQCRRAKFKMGLHAKTLRILLLVKPIGTLATDPPSISVTMYQLLHPPALFQQEMANGSAKSVFSQR